MNLLRAKLSREQGLFESLPLKIKKLIEDFGEYETFQFIYKDEDGKTISRKTSNIIGQKFILKTKMKEFEVEVLPEGYVKIQESVKESRFVKLYESFSSDFIRKLNEFFPENYEELKDVLEMWNGKKRTVEDTLEKCAFIIDNYGVESIRASDVDDSYFLETVALYLNLEDKFATTIIYDVTKNRFMLTSISDWKYENRHKYEFI